MPGLERGSPHPERWVDTARENWWQLLDAEDPVTLEPLAKLPLPPFDLRKDASHACWFDGRVLAALLISQGSFTHPVSGRRLTRADCEALDLHLIGYKFVSPGSPCVAYAFDHQQDYTKSMVPENPVARPRKEASTLLCEVIAKSPRGRRAGGEDRRKTVLAPAGGPYHLGTAPARGSVVSLRRPRHPTSSMLHILLL